MAISKIGGTGSDNWELISSVTPTAASAAVNFTGLSPYKKLAIRVSGVVFGSSGILGIRLNNDSGSNYDISYTLENATPRLALEVETHTYWYFSKQGSTNHLRGFVEIQNCDNSGIKILSSGYKEDDLMSTNYYGVYLASAVISQVNVISSTTFTAAGTVALYGVK